MPDLNLFLTFDERRSLAAGHTRWNGTSHVRCPNKPCPTCDNLPGGWTGWCVRCGACHDEHFDLCNACERLLFWQELFW